MKENALKNKFINLFEIDLLNKITIIETIKKEAKSITILRIRGTIDENKSKKIIE
jgi:hypothetical protein